MNLLQKKTQKWVEQNIITSKQQTQILEQEQTVFRPFLALALLWGGIICMVLGVGSVLADNWSLLPDWLKVIGGVFLLVGCFGSTLYFIRKQKRGLAEIGLFLSFLGIGALIGLIAQVFSLPLDTGTGLLIWALIAFIIVILSQKQYLSFLWIPLFVGGLLGYLKWEFLFLFFQQVPLATTFFSAILFWMIAYIAGKGQGIIAASIYRWSVILYLVVMVLGDFAAHTRIAGFMITLILLAGLLLLAVLRDKRFLFNVTAGLIGARLVGLYFQIFTGLTSLGIIFIIAGILIFIGLWLRSHYIEQQKRASFSEQS